MKKNKKYWKKLAKHWSNQLELMEAKYWEAEYTISILQDQLDVLRNQGESQAIALEATKRELSYFRQRNIGKKQVIKESATLPESNNTTGTSGSGYFYNTTIDFTKPKKKKGWGWNK